MATLFRKGSDNLLNGMSLGAAAGALIVWGQKVQEWLVPLIPVEWKTFAGEFSIPIILIGTGALIGYLIDRR